ncbi:MAG TPA: HemK2/MTQ2 family protein methyltransferase [Pseudonocardia sp.]|nr:HemK2/MTQ2 family protein methyltransferase [Pseudonocardia sp.]
MICPPGVYRAQSDTELLIGVLRRDGLPAGRHVLDIGTGAGPLALAASRAGAASVTAVDISRRAVMATWLNARMSRARIQVRRGDLFAGLGDRRFDLIVTNPPYVPAPVSDLPSKGIARCWDAGLDGRAVVDRICAGVADRLSDGGMMVMVHSAMCGTEETLARLGAVGLEAKVLERGLIPFGVVMRERAALLAERGLIEPGATLEELVVIGARRAG